MRPYAAIIKDSFREALASRVLWVLTGFILLVLLALAPLGYRLNLTGEFAWGDINDGHGLAKRLREDGPAEASSPSRRIWSLLDEDTRGQVEKLAAATDEKVDQNYFPGVDAMRKGFNQLLARRDFYTEQDWQGVTLPKEARDLLERPRDSLSKQELTRLNRLLIEAAAPGSFVPRSPYSVVVTYFWFHGDPWPFSKDQVDSFIKQWVLPTMMSWIVGVFGMIAAILVTSTIIPQMFEPGSITLLLSKPVSRSLLLSAKFLGGCAFVFINVTLLLVGLWLIAGWRFGVWNHGILWCIPVFLFMFLVYYAVSAFTGLIWKSAIISVVVTVLFWIACFIVDLAHSSLQGLVLEQQRIQRIVEADGALLTLNEATSLQMWDEEDRQWRTVSERRGGPGLSNIVGPYYHASSGQLLIGQGFRHPLLGIQQRISLHIANAAGGWKFTEGPTLPSGTSSFVITADETIYAIASDNIFRFEGDPAGKPATVNMFGFRVPIAGGGQFRPALQGKRPPLPDPAAAAADPRQARLVVAAANDVYLFQQQEDGNLEQAARYSFEGREVQGSVVAIAGGVVVVAREDGRVWVLDAGDLSLKETLSLEDRSQPRMAVAAADGSRIAILYQNRNLWLIDAATGAAERAAVASQGEISGLAWSGDRLFVADYANRVIAYDAETLKRGRVYRPPLTRLEMAYYYLIEPLYTVFPKPRMLNNTVQYLVTGERTPDMGVLRGNLAQQRDDLDPWRPVTSGLIFVAVVLLVACFYIERHEF